jgi:hypothetical protein
MVYAWCQSVATVGGDEGEVPKHWLHDLLLLANDKVYYKFVYGHLAFVTVNLCHGVFGPHLYGPLRLPITNA